MTVKLGVIEAGGYGPDLAGVYLLGRDMQRVAGVATLGVLLGIINDHLKRLTLAIAQPNRYLADVEAWVKQRVLLLRRGLATPLDDVAG